MGKVVSMVGADSCASKDACTICPARALGLCAATEYSPESDAKLAVLAERMSFAAHDVVLEQGAAATHVYALSQGTLKLSRVMADGRAHVAGFLECGDLLGLPGLDGVTHAYEATALTPVRLCRFRRDRLLALTGEFPALGRRLSRMVAGELAAAQDQMLLLGRKTAQEKVASFLLGLQAKAARRGVAADSVHLPMSRCDIADHLGLTVETVSRCFTKLKATGAIRLLEGSRVQFRNVDALAGLAEAA